MFFDMACGSLIYYIITLLPEVQSSCQAGRSCCLDYQTRLTDGFALYPVEKLHLHLWNGVMLERNSIMNPNLSKIIHPLHGAL
jgi:hypothetical protein